MAVFLTGVFSVFSAPFDENMEMRFIKSLEGFTFTLDGVVDDDDCGVESSSFGGGVGFCVSSGIVGVVFVGVLGPISDGPFEMGVDIPILSIFSSVASWELVTLGLDGTGVGTVCV